MDNMYQVWEIFPVPFKMAEFASLLHALHYMVQQDAYKVVFPNGEEIFNRVLSTHPLRLYAEVAWRETEKWQYVFVTREGLVWFSHDWPVSLDPNGYPSAQYCQTTLFPVGTLKGVPIEESVVSIDDGFRPVGAEAQKARHQFFGPF